jgi:hypothetical protein
MGSTRILVCMKSCGGPNDSVIGAVEAVIGCSFARISSMSADGGMGPAPEEPVSVICGGLYRASF